MKNTDQPSIVLLDHATITPGENARKYFDLIALAGLKASIREHGVMQNVIVTPHPEHEGRFVLCAGERRWRATGDLLAELETEGMLDLLARRRQMPAQVLGAEEGAKAFERGLIENLQRENITPLEEADAFFAMEHSINPDTGGTHTHKEIAAKISKLNSDKVPDAAYVRKRLKLRNAPEPLLQEVNNKTIAPSVAELIGRIPDPKAREQAAKLVLKPKNQETPLNYVQTKALLQESFMVSLRGCGFDVQSAEMVPVETDEEGQRASGGACDDCPFRSGNNPEIQEDLSVGSSGKRGRTSGVAADVCTNPGCFRRKQDAAWRIMRARAEEAGHKVIDGDAARKVFSGWQGEIAYDSLYADLDGKPSGELVDWKTDVPKWSKIIAEADVPVVIARNPHTGAIHKLVNKRGAVEAVKAAGRQDGTKTIFDRADPRTDSEKQASENKAAREQAKLEVAVAHEAAKELVERITKRGIGLDEQWLVFLIQLDHAGADGQFFLGKMLDLKLDKAQSGRDYAPGIRAHVKEVAETKQALEAWGVLAMLSREMKWRGAGEESNDFLEVAQSYGLRIEDVEKRVKVVLAAGKKGVKAAGADVQGGVRECAHCKEQIEHASEAEFFEHVKKCSKKAKTRKPSKTERLKAAPKKPATTTKPAKKAKAKG